MRHRWGRSRLGLAPLTQEAMGAISAATEQTGLEIKPLEGDELKAAQMELGVSEDTPVYEIVNKRDGGSSEKFAVKKVAQ